MFEWLPERIEQAQQVFQEFSLDWTFILNPPATETEIRACEEALGVTLPPSYREFLLRHNGANFFVLTWAKRTIAQYGMILG
ncbi:SMI1/KNR4 family protein [Chlorogloeopsis fritschii]|uniref:SMI1/KNR4 family protein n=1 Tax=Chlorogloeopsis fritschii TaxID=1124 RepID=UPI0023F62A69|nr:SMI1/KNR4 family protein [Chlorogloeopsis fritschii]